MSAAGYVVKAARRPTLIPSSSRCIRTPRSFHTTPLSPSQRSRFLERVHRVLAQESAHEDRDKRVRRTWREIAPSRAALNLSNADPLSRYRHTLKAVESAIQREFGAEYTVEPFGSVRYGLYTADSDLDLVIMDPHAPYGWPPQESKISNRQRKRTINRTNSPYNVKRLATVLARAGFVIEQTIPWASVPIVKARDRRTHVRFDINVNDRLGLYNSDLIKEYCNLHKIVRPFMAATKHWAKVHGFNEPSTANARISFSSYSLALMAIAFLQSKGMLPNLQSNLRDLPPSVLEGHFWPSAQRERCDVRYFTYRNGHYQRLVSPAEALSAPPADQHRFRMCRYTGDDAMHTPRFPVEFTGMPSYRVPPGMTLAGLLEEWFGFWGHGFDPRVLAMSVREGGLVRRRDVPQALVKEESEFLEELGEEAEAVSPENALDPLFSNHTKPKKASVFCLLDPFIRSKNCAAAVHRAVFADFQNQARAAHDDLLRGAPAHLVIAGDTRPRPRHLSDALRRYTFQPFYPFVRESPLTEGEPLLRSLEARAFEGGDGEVVAEERGLAYEGEGEDGVCGRSRGRGDGDGRLEALLPQ